MAENVENQQQDNGQIAASAELAQQMAISLNGGIVPQEQGSENQQGNNQEGQQRQNNEGAQAPIVVPFEFKTFQEKFGYEKPEDIETEIAQLRELKAKPPVTEQPKFENETSENVYKLLQAGKYDEVNKVLTQQNRLSSLISSEVTNDNAADIIKLGMQLEHKTLTDSEIERLYNKKFAIPKEPKFDENNETEDEFNIRKSDWQEIVDGVNADKRIEAKMAIPKLETAKTDLKLPQLENQVDEEYVQWQKTMDDQIKLEGMIAEAYKSVTPETLETKIPFSDDQKKVSFEFQYKPDAKLLQSDVAIAEKIDNWMLSFVKSDGQFDKEGYLQAVHFAKNKDAVIKEAITQGINAYIKSQLPDNQNGNGIGQRQQINNAGEKTEFQKQMDASLRV